MQTFKKFLFRELIFTILVVIVALILFNSVLAQYYLPVFWVLLGLITVLTGVLHYSIIQIQNSGASKFANRFMMVSGIKMMAYLVLITTYAFTNPSKASVFLILFFVLYLLYTVFEVILIVQYLKKNKNHT